MKLGWYGVVVVVVLMLVKCVSSEHNLRSKERDGPKAGTGLLVGRFTSRAPTTLCNFGIAVLIQVRGSGILRSDTATLQ